MVKLCEDLLGEILSRLSEEDLLKCQSVSKSWRRVISHLWVLRFWTHKSPVLGLYFRTTGLEPSRNFYHFRTTGLEPSHIFHHMNYISLYNYSFMVDNLERDPSTTPESTFLKVKQELQFFRHRRWTVAADDYLDCCNGLVLVFKSSTHQLYVCNPVTRRHVAIPKALDHQQQQFSAALAFDPAESPSHCRVVRIDPSSSSLDMFSSQSCRWARHQLDPDFTQGFDLCRRHFVYLRGVLYSIASSGDQLLCIHLNTATVQSRSFQLPDSVSCQSQACLGVSMETLCYFYRHDESNMFHVWSYDDSSSGEWVLRFSISCKKLRWLMLSLGYHYDDTPATFEPYAISPSSDVIFFGTPKLILSYDFNTGKIKFVCESCFNAVASPVFALRACFLPLYKLRKRNGGSTDVFEDSPAVSEEILSEELPCDEELEEDDDEIQVVNIKLFSREQKRLIFPSEMH